MSNLYVRVMTGFYSHRKTARLRAKIGDDAFWIPPRLWAYAAENQPDGDLSGYTSEELSELLGCPKYATSILQALKDTQFVNEDGFIHNWSQHNGYHETYAKRAKLAAQARWAKEKPPIPPKETKKEEIGKGKGETSIASSIDKQCLEDATSMYSPESRVALHFLNEQTGKHFRESETSLAPINARLKEPGVDIAGVRQMITRQCLMWKDTRMQEYLRPETLFGKEKFNSYYASKDMPVSFEDRKQPELAQNGF